MKQFLSESVELLAIGLPEMKLTDFIKDAGGALDYWQAAKQKSNWGKHWNDFVRVRDKVRSRRKEANPSQVYEYDQLLRRWDRWISPDNNPMLPPPLPER